MDSPSINNTGLLPPVGLNPNSSRYGISPICRLTSCASALPPSDIFSHRITGRFFRDRRRASRVCVWVVSVGGGMESGAGR